MDVYFSHSYRDVPINEYFSGLFDAAGITLRADQKTGVWCIAKLERYMFEMGGFVSIITRRVEADESLTYSSYIGRELMLARRARTPRILFVDDQVLDLYRKAFPPSAIPFFHEAPETEQTHHVEAISQFRKQLAGGGARPPRQYVAKQATVIAGQGSVLRDAASRVAAILRSEGFKTTVVSGATELAAAFDDIDVFELELSSELCVFVLGKDLSCLDVPLAMAQAHCIPSVQLRYDLDAKSCAPELSGAVRWESAAELVSAFGELLQNYQSAFASASGKDVIEKLATPEQISKAFNEWDPCDGPSLIVHVIPDDRYVSDRVNGVLNMLASTETGRGQSDTVCRALYDRIKKDHFYYTFEPVLSKPHVQNIRKPKDIATLNCGTCIDFACFFASLLEAAHERPVVIVAKTGQGAHALAGYLTLDAVLGPSPTTLGDLRGAINRGEIVVFETTGAAEVRNRTVGVETKAERKEGNNQLDYQTAKNAGKRFLIQDDLELIHFVDVQQTRQDLN
jgi:hypothetical protein